MASPKTKRRRPCDLETVVNLADEIAGLLEQVRDDAFDFDHEDPTSAERAASFLRKARLFVQRAEGELLGRASFAHKPVTPRQCWRGTKGRPCFSKDEK